MNQTTQRRLLAEYVSSRSEKAFQELVRRNIDHAYSVAFHMTRDVEVSQDVVQQVFTRLACDPDIPQKVPIQSWVHTTTRSLAIDVLRNEISRKMRERKYAQSANMNSSQEVWEELRPVLDDVINRLKPTDRQAVVLRFYHQLSHADIGNELGVTANAARVRLQRAIERLRLLLAKKGITTTATALSMTLSTYAFSPSPATLATAVSSSALAVATTNSAGSSIIFTTVFAMTKLQKLLAAALILIAPVTYLAWQPRGDEATAQIENTPASRNTLLSPRVGSSSQPDAADDPFADKPLRGRHDHTVWGRNEFIEKSVAEWAAAEEGVYRELFEDLGVPDEKVKQLLLELRDVKRTILVAELAIGDSQKQKNRYRKLVEDSVGKEAFEEYRDYELGKPADKEIAKFDKFIEESEMDAVLTVEEKSLLADLIKQTGAVTDIDWGGPFSATPAPARGQEAVIAHFAQMAKEIEERSNELLMEIERRGGSQSMYDAVSGYYEAQIQSNLSAVEEESRPSEERHAELMEMIKRDHPEVLINPAPPVEPEA